MRSAQDIQGVLWVALPADTDAVARHAHCRPDALVDADVHPLTVAVRIDQQVIHRGAQERIIRVGAQCKVAVHGCRHF